MVKFRSGARAHMRPLFAECALAFADAHGVEALGRAGYEQIRSALPEQQEQTQ